MLPQTIKVVLLDIEGTTSSISFVHDVLFPFARRLAPSFLETHWSRPEVAEAGKLLLEEANLSHLVPSPSTAFQAIEVLMDRDAKVTGLKKIQGWIWKQGYDSGELKAHVYPDLVDALKKWKSQGLRLFIYSSGSIEAQKLFFGHTIEGNLLPYFEGHFDTTIGPKVESSSYKNIAASMGTNPSEICFFSDAIKEIQAAKQAGLEVRLTIRPGNPPVDPEIFPSVQSFEGL